MTELEASRTLVKSPPELWAECSDAAALARHLDGFGEIRITRLDPETAVAWEGERARGTVRIEPAGWGTKVVLTAQQLSEEAPPPDKAEVPSEPEPVAAEQPPPARRRRFARLFSWRRVPESVIEPGVEEAPADPPTEPERPEPPPPAATDTEAALTAALDSLGQAHHRPYSRA